MAIIDSVRMVATIDKGWSGDRKYCVCTDDGTKLLLRFSPLKRLENRTRLFEMLKQVDSLGIPMCRPVECGVVADKVYMLMRFIEGQDAETIIPTLPTDSQYAYGLDAGRILKRIHSLPAPDTQEPWDQRFNRKIDKKIETYRKCPIRYPGGDAFLQYIAENRHLLSNVPQSFQHGDYHIGNMMIDDTGVLTIIDFDRYDFGDPWEEFNRIVWCAHCSAHFASGLVDGYFDGTPPMVFWKMLALYILSNTLSSIPWAIPFGQEQIDIMLRQAQQVLAWYDNMHVFVPKWYLGERAHRFHRCSLSLT